MKKIFFILLVIAMTGCSEKSNQNSQDTVIQQENAAALTLISGSGEMGEVTSSKLVTLIVQNTGTEATVAPAMLSIIGPNSSDFSIVYNLGCNQIIARGQRCTTKVSFNATGKSPGTYTANLNVGSLISIPLSATIPQPAGGTSTTGGSSGGNSSGLVAIVDSIDSSSGVNYGDLIGTQSVIKTIFIKNIGTVTAPIASAAVSSTDYSIIFNQCSNIALQPNKQCQVRVSFSAAGKTPQTYSSNLTFGLLTVPLNSNVLGSSSSTTGGSSGGSSGGPVALLSVLENSIEISNPLDYGNLSGTQSVTKVLFVRNNGTTATTVTATLSNTNFSMIFNQCNNRSLAVNGTCQIRLQFNAAGKSSQVYSTNLNFTAQNLSFPIQATVPGITCGPNQRLENGTCVDNIIACTINNGTGSRTWNGSAYGPCTVTGCNVGFENVSNQCLTACASGKHREGAFCVNDVRSCFIANGTGSQTWNTGVWGDCTLVSCNATHHQNGNLCDPNQIACSAVELPSNSTAGVKNWDGSQYGTCAATNCESTYDLYQGQCFAQIQVSPGNQTVSSGQVLNLNVSGGVPPYSYSLDPASTIASTVDAFSGDNAVGVFTAGVNSGSGNIQEIVKVTDQRGVSAQSTINVTPSNVSLPLALAGDNTVVSYGITYPFVATGGTPPYVYSVVSYVGSVVDPSTGDYIPGDNQQIDLVTDLLRVTDNTGAFVEIRLYVSNNIQVMYPVLYNFNTGQYVSSFSDNDSSVSITIRNTPSDKYIRVYSDSTCSGNQIYEGLSYGGDTYVSDSIWESYDTSRTYSVSEEDYDFDLGQPTYSNVNCSSYTVSYYYDVTPPEIYSVSATSGGGNIANLTVSTSGATTVNYYKDLNCSESIGGNNAYDTFNYDVGSTPGVFFFTATATDDAGNTSECSNGGYSNGMTMNQYAIYEHLLGDSGLFPIVTGNTVDNGVAYYNQSYIPVYVYGNSIEYDYADLFLDSTCSTTPVASATTTGNSPFNTYISGYFVSGDIFNDADQNPIADGTYQVYARRGLDQSFNSCSVASIPIVIDRQAPDPVNLSLVQGTFNTTGNLEFDFGGIESNVSLVLGRKCQNSPYGVIFFNDRINELTNVTSSNYNYNLGDNGGFYRFAVSTRDRAGNFSQCSNTITYEYDNGRPYITDISSSTADGVYGIGQIINIRLTFNKAIQKLNNSGSLSLRISNSISRSIPLSSALASGNHLDFSYTVQSGDNTGTGKISVEGFSNFGGAIVDAGNNSLYANTKIPDEGLNKRLEEKHSLKGDGVGPSTGLVAFALTGGGNNYTNSTQSSAPVNVTNPGVDQGGGVVAGFEVAIGTSTSNRTNVLNWTDVGSGPNNLFASGLSLSTGTFYYLSVRSYDNFGNKSNFFSFGSNNYGLFTVDNLPPLGKIAWVDDREFGTSAIQTMSINFPGALNSGGVESPDVANYFVAIGTEPGGTSILNWSNINNHNVSSLYLNTSNRKRYKLQVTGINLNANTIYYASIRYCDFASNCKEAYGNGFTIKNSDGFSQKNYLKSSNKVANGRYGSSVAVEGNYMVVGASGEGAGGRVYVYKRVSGTNQLIEEAVLTASNGEAGDEFGASVAISGNRIIIGAPGEDGASNNISNSGAAYVFKKTTSWSQESILRAHNAGADDRFGDRVKISQQGAAVSALYEDSDFAGIINSFAVVPDNNNVSNSGAVYMYTVDNTTQQWVQETFIKKANSATCGTGSSQCAESTNDNFGFAIDLKGGVLAVGTPYHDLAFVGFQHRYIDLGGGVGSSSAAARSAYPNSGIVHIFHKQSIFWSSAYNLRSPNIDPGDEFGYSVAISEIDSTSNNFSELSTNITNYMIAGGVPGEDHGTFISSLHQETYQGGGIVDGATNRRFLTNSNILPVQSASGSTGTYLNNNLSNSGAVYVFAYEPIWEGQNLSMASGGTLPLAMHLYSYLKAPNLGAEDRFGSSLGLVGNLTFGWDRTVNPMAPTSIQRAVSYLVVGAPKEDNSATGVQLWFSANNIWNGSSIISDNNSATDSGAVYVFKHGYENILQLPANQKSDFVLQQYIKPPVSKAGDEFGSQISASVNSWIIGVPLDDANANSSQSASGSSDTSLSNSGAVYIINSLD
jgi:hypothetical protein